MGVGMALLVARDWWDRTKTRLARWWLEGQAHPPAANGGPRADSHPLTR
ncbi:MAG: hypothetical protein ACR2HN_01750 [Tepidiformaceae bacterium]